MDASTSLLTRQTYARLAGFLYLLVISVYMAGSFLTGSFHFDGDPAATARAVSENELAYRVGITMQLLSSALTILLGGAFYAFLRHVDGLLALFALLWRVCEAVLGGVTAIFLLMAAKLYASEPFPSTLEPLVHSLRSGSSASFLVAVTFFGIGSTVFFFLLLKSRYVPRCLALLGFSASVLVWVMALATLIAPASMSGLVYAWVPIFIAEIVVGLWLWIRGISEGDNQWPSVARSSRSSKLTDVKKCTD